MLKRTLGFTNDYIAKEHGRENMFATVFMGVVDLQTGQLDYINAGHEAPLLYRERASTRPRAQRCDSLEPQGLAVGALPNRRYEARRIWLEPGDRLLAVTDGVTEASGASGMFGEQRVQALLAEHLVGTQALLGEIDRQLAQHSEGHEQRDDITMLCLARCMPANA